MARKYRYRIISRFAEIIGVTYDTAAMYFDAFTTVITEEIKENKECGLQHFGRFYLQKRKGMWHNDFRNNKRIFAPEHTILRFSPYAAFRKEIAGIELEEEENVLV